MIEDRPLNREEVYSILETAPDSEVRNLKRFLEKYKLDAFNFLNRDAVDSFGLIIDGVPAYFAYLIPCLHRYELWTVVNSNVKEQFSLFKHSKRKINKVLEKFSPVYAKMEKHNINNINWVTRLGFKKIDEDDKTVLFEIKKGE